MPNFFPVAVLRFEETSIEVDENIDAERVIEIQTSVPVDNMNIRVRLGSISVTIGVNPDLSTAQLGSPPLAARM